MAERYTWNQRTLILLLCALICIAYLDRVAISYALVPAADEFGLTPTQQGVILSAFSWGYVAAMIPGGLLADRVGPSRVLGWAAAGWAVCSVATTLAGGVVGLIVVRIALGVAEAPSFPSAAGIVVRDFTPVQRSRATALFDGGSYVGLLIAGPTVGLVIASVGWRPGLALAGVVNVLWLVAWLVFRRGTRRADPRPRTTRSMARVWFLSRQRTVLFMSFGFFAYNYVKSFFLTWFPIYLVGQLRFTKSDASLISGIPPAAALVATLGVGVLTDRLITRGARSATVRQRFVVGGLVVSSVMGLSGIVGDRVVAVVLMTVAFAGVISASSGIWALPGDVSPDVSWVSTIGGVQNAISNVGGIVAPIVTGFTVEHSAGSYTPALLITCVVALIGAGLYLTSGVSRGLRQA
ncbi:MFS transporter [Kibdelosporangium lantanae]